MDLTQLKYFQAAARTGNITRAAAELYVSQPNLSKSITGSSGVMPNYAMSYSEDGSLGELLGGAYSSYKIGLLRENDFRGFILTDWEITKDGGAGSYTVTEYTPADRFAMR